MSPSKEIRRRCREMQNDLMQSAQNPHMEPRDTAMIHIASAVIESNAQVAAGMAELVERFGAGAVTSTEEDPLYRSVVKLHERMGGTLVCTTCHQRTELSPSELQTAIERGFPMCCGLSKLWVPKNHPAMKVFLS